MNRLVLVFICFCAAVPVIIGRPSIREEKCRRSKPRPSSESADDTVHALRPGNSGQCWVNGMSLFDGTMWSSQPCSVCQCERGAVSCHTVPCVGSTNQQNVAPKAKNPSTDAQRKKEILKPKKSLQRRAEIQKDVQPVTKDSTVAVLKPLVTQKKKEVETKKQDKVMKTEMRRTEVLVAKKHEHKTSKPNVSYRPYDEDGDDHSESDEDDEDDEDYITMATPQKTTRAIAGPALEPAGRPVRIMSVRLPKTLPKKPVPRVQGRPVVTFPRRQSVMESLPAGCLLSDSLIACGSTGMVHFPILSDRGVKNLYLADNKISKIPPWALAGLPNLEWLDLSRNKLEDSSISPDLFQNLTKLRRLNLDGNNLTKVPLFLPPSLVELKMNDNEILSLTPSSFKGLSKLLTLELEDNNLHDGNVSPLTFRPLQKLIYLRLEDNKFRAVPSGLPTTLQTLHLSDNRIEEVHERVLNKTVNLRFLDLSHNKIREDRIAPRAWIHLLKLESLDLSYNKLVHVPSFLPVGLQQLHLHHNQIERIPGYVFGHLKPGLDLLHLSHNRLGNNGIDDVSFLGLYNSLTELLLDHNLLRSIPKGLLKLKSLQLLRLNHNVIKHVPLNSICDTRLSDDSPLVSVHLEYNLIEQRLIPATALSCIQTYHSIILRPQSHQEDDLHQDY